MPKLSFNRTIFGIETEKSETQQAAPTIAFNRTIFGIETLKDRNKGEMIALLIAPFLELKPNGIVYGKDGAEAFNRTIFGIETHSERCEQYGHMVF